MLQRNKILLYAVRRLLCILKDKNGSHLCTQHSNSCGNKVICPELFIMTLYAIMLLFYIYAFCRFQNTFIFFASPEYNNPHFKDKNIPWVREIQWFPQDHTARTGRAESFKSDRLVPGKHPFLLTYNSQKSQQPLWPLRRRWLHVPWPLGQGSVTSFEPFHNSKQKYPSIPERNEEVESWAELYRWWNQRNYICMHVCREVGEGTFQLEHPPSPLIVITLAVLPSVLIAAYCFHVRSLLWILHQLRDLHKARPVLETEIQRDQKARLKCWSLLD